MYIRCSWQGNHQIYSVLIYGAGQPYVVHLWQHADTAMQTFKTHALTLKNPQTLSFVFVLTCAVLGPLQLQRPPAWPLPFRPAKQRAQEK